MRGDAHTHLLAPPPDALAPERSIESMPDRHSVMSSSNGTDADLVGLDESARNMSGNRESPAPENPVNFNDFLGRSSEILPGTGQATTAARGHGIGGGGGGAGGGTRGQRRGSVGVDASRLPGTLMSDYDKGLVPGYERPGWMQGKGRNKAKGKGSGGHSSISREQRAGPDGGVEQPSMSSMLSGSDASGRRSGDRGKKGDGMLGRLQTHLQEMGVEMTDDQDA